MQTKIYVLQECDREYNPISSPLYYENSIASYFSLNQNMIYVGDTETTIEKIEKAADENGWAWKTLFCVKHPANPFFDIEARTDYYWISPIDIRK